MLEKNYVVFVQGNKKALGRVKKDLGEVVSVLTEPSQTSVEIDKSAILAVLGTNPPQGKVYGVDVKPKKYGFSIDETEVTSFISRSIFDQKSLTREVTSAFNSVKEDTKKVANRDIAINAIDLQHKNNKTAGMYYQYKDGSNKVEVYLDSMDVDEIYEILAHEVGHHVWYDMVTPVYKTKWIKLFHESALDVIHVPTKTIKSFWDEFAASGHVEDDQQKALLKMIRWHLSKVHHLSSKSVKHLLSTGESIAEYLPDNGYMSLPTATLTEYATKSAEEFFAEAYRLYLLNTLPKSIDKAMDKTLGNLMR
jgi:hypothetical protein